MQIDSNKKGSQPMKPFTSLRDPDWIQTNDLLLRRPKHFYKQQQATTNNSFQTCYRIAFYALYVQKEKNK